jgi:hypothetical protein
MKILPFAGNKVTGYSIYRISPENGYTIKGEERLGRVMRQLRAAQSKGRQNWWKNKYFN